MSCIDDFPFRRRLVKAVGKRWCRARQQLCLLFVALACCATGASAAQVLYTATHVAGTQWTYAYVVSNEAAAADILELSIYFDPLLYSNLTLGSVPAGWDALLVQPDPAIPDDGFLDVLAMGAGIGAGESLAGLSVLFDFSGAGTPGAQWFEVLDPVTFAVLASGMTVPEGPAEVPEPSTMLLAGLALLACARRRNAGNDRGMS